MKPIVRRVLIGLVCGTVSSLFLCLALRNIALGLSFGALLGVAQVFAFFDLESGSAIDHIFYDAGTFTIEVWTDDEVIVSLAGEKLAGRVYLSRLPHPSDRWHLRFDNSSRRDVNGANIKR